jgi:L-rhamnonate dehydratase
VGYATGFGGPPACWLIEEHFKRFVIGKDPRDTNLIWEQVSVAHYDILGRLG